MYSQSKKKQWEIC